MNIRENSVATAPRADGLEGLLAAVVAASRCMLEHPDVRAGLQAAMEPLGALSGHDRAYVFQLQDDQQVCKLVAEWSRPGVASIVSLSGTTRFSVADFPEVWQRLLAGKAYQSAVSAKTGANALLNRTVANRGDLMVPIFLDAQCWGCVGFDNCREERRYSEAEIQVLRGAAAAVAAALRRERAEGHAEVLSLEHLQLLGAVTEAAQALLTPLDFDSAIEAAMDILGRELTVDRVGLVQDLSAPHAAGNGLWRLTHEWVAPGVAPQMDSVAATGNHPSAEWSGRSRAGEALVVEIGHNDGMFDAGQASIGVVTSLSVPVFLESRWWGVVGFDSSRARAWLPHEVAVLQTAAACIGAALGRRQAEDERLAQVKAQAQQAVALNALTQAVVRSTRDLLDSADFAAGVARWLAQLGLAAQADMAMLIDLGHDRSGLDGPTPTWTNGWRRDGRQVRSTTVPSTVDFDAWTRRLMAQEPIWAHIDELVDPASVQFWRDTDCVTNLLMPVVYDGTVSYVLCFDWRTRRDYSAADVAVLRTAADSFAAVLYRQTANERLLAERQRRLIAEELRAREASAHAARMQRRSRLMAAVASAAEELLAADDLDACFDQVLARIGSVTDADRACLAWLQWTPQDPAVLAWQEISNEWTRPGAVRQMEGTSQRFPMRRDDATWDRAFRQFEREGRMLMRVDDMDEPFRSEQRALGLVWNLTYPVFVEGQMLALLGFDYATDVESYDSTDIDALKTVASSLANAHWRRELQARALAAERARADENERLASLLSQVVAASRLLIDAEPANFEPAMREWLGAIGRETHALRATLYDLAEWPWTGQTTVRMLCEWVREGVAGSVPCSFTQPFVLDPSGAEQIMAQITSGRLVAVHAAQTRGAMRDFLEAQGNATVVAVPVFLGGRQWGAVSVDFSAHRELNSTDAAVLQTAADTLAAILRRNEAAAALLAEREARLLAEQNRSRELSRVNDTLRQALDALAGADGDAAFLRGLLVQLQRQTGALAAYLFRSDDSDGRLHLVGRASQGEFSDQPAPDDPAMFSRGFALVPALQQTLNPLGRFLWRKVDPNTPVDDDTPESMRWHVRMGHQANAVQALTVGDRQVGFIGMVFDRPEPLTEAELDLAHALSHPITLALEMARLSRLAQRGSEQTAMLKERNRLAREIHDGIAQAFLAIQMQLDPLGDNATGPAPVHKALALARHGLTEARRAVAALRPQGLLKSDLPTALQRLLQTAETDSVRCSLIRPPAWQRLPSDAEDHLFRIVQEAVNNALRHAQPAGIRVELSQAAGETTVLVADDGAGFDLGQAALRPGFGLESMQQRAELIGARIDWLTSPGKGTQVLLSWTSTSSAAGHAPAPPKAAG